MNHFKGSVTRWCHSHGFEDFQWQSRFHDHIIGNDKSLQNIRNYIHFNVEKWQDDQEHPKNFI